MRRAHAGNEGGYYQPTAQMLESENDRMEQELSGKVKALKSLSIDIGNEVREQNKFLGEMDEDYDKSGNLLLATMGRLKAITKSGGPKLWCYMLLFCLFVFFLIWVIVRFR
ncbi:BET1 homolog [Crassostrea angulata]|uniref:t-SNARE coiled-coil homology domain-containing protein n=1 Tax=Magallana gigas TaxID=29159 RepID=A0A8W8NDV6_MAGGI|nr:BET1 homolog [Crassostrea gigas]XP_052679840.1 BET1 homolog [Crassostrea angulata]|eukprot:XP_011451070.1 PREDICTED: BET1 homolog [Crassostrea gigas]